ncbi:MAG: DUF4157 domain-containing protein, partial [Woeseiaceae bacterium]
MSPFSGLIQRKCTACGGETGTIGECTCHEKRAKLDLKRKATAQGPSSSVPPIVSDVLSTPGQPLEPGIRSVFESRLGHAFGAVRVHADVSAAESTKAIHAMAYTHGKHIVFGRGQYAPGSATGRRLLAHELTHVVQQSRGSGGAGGMLRLGVAESDAEHEADTVARSVVDGQPIAISGAGAGDIQRACLSAAECAAPVPGSAQEFGESEEDREAVARARRGR